MAERKFDYENISNVYNEMKKITGTESDVDSIAGILHKIDEDVHNSVAVEDESIFGPLGNQLLLDWENTSSDFPNFVNNFSNWSTLIAQSANEYDQFEKIVESRKTENPLGLTSKGMGQNYIDTSFYKDYTNSNYQQYVSDLANVRQLNPVDLTAVQYVCTDSQSILEEYKKQTQIVAVADIAAIVIWAWAAAPAAGAGTTVTTTTTTTPALPAASSASTLALPGTVATPISEAATSLALNVNNVAPAAFAQMQTALSSAEAAGATFVQAGTAANTLECINNAGTLIGFIKDGIFMVAAGA